MSVRRNKTLNDIEAIEEKIKRELSHVSMDDDHDRAEMSMWIHKNFCRGDFRANIHVVEPVSTKKNIQLPGPEKL